VDEPRAKLRINLAQREFEVEGSEGFVRTYADRLDQLLGRLSEQPGAAPPPNSGAPESSALPSTQSFGELLHRLPRGASDVDRMLIAGHFVQQRAADNAFSTGEANALLTEQGIKVGNPSQCVKQSLMAKRVFKHQGRYRVSQTGADHLRQLLGARLPG
jgi:hypothetical protein